MIKKCFIASLLFISSLPGIANDNVPSKTKSTSTETSMSSSYLKLTDEIQRYARKLKGIRYAWGGKATKGFDCSGLVNYVFAKFGMKTERRSSDLFKVGYNMSPDNALPGDLIFFRGTTHITSGISHVGIVLESTAKGVKFIHSASSKGVSISYLNEKYYSSHFAGIRRVIDTLKDSVD